MIEVRNLVKRYGDHIAVDHLSFTVEKGQIYGFLGPNGAGKSTTMNIITGYIGLTEGEVLINGHDITKEPAEARKSIGYLPELPPLYMDMTVKEYLDFAADLKKIPKAEREEAVKTVMEMTGITDMSRRLVGNLSKGYKQRVGLSQAILGFPDVIILDEPTVGLDPRQIIEIRDLIRSLAKEHTVILSSHILSEVQAVCDHVIIIHHGKLVASGTPQELEDQMHTSALEMTIKADNPSVVKSALSGVAGINNLRCVKAVKDGEVSVSLDFADDNSDPREAIFYACAKANLPILMTKDAGLTLEQIFLELVADTSDGSEAEENPSKPVSSKPVKPAPSRPVKPAQPVKPAATAKSVQKGDKK